MQCSFASSNRVTILPFEMAIKIEKKALFHRSTFFVFEVLVFLISAPNRRCFYTKNEVEKIDFLACFYKGGGGVRGTLRKRLIDVATQG